MASIFEAMASLWSREEEEVGRQLAARPQKRIHAPRVLDVAPDAELGRLLGIRSSGTHLGPGNTLNTWVAAPKLMEWIPVFAVEGPGSQRMSELGTEPSKHGFLEQASQHPVGQQETGRLNGYQLGQFQKHCKQTLLADLEDARI